MMTIRTLFRYRVLTFFALIFCTACTPRIGAGEISTKPELAIDLPAIVIDIDANGQATIDQLPIDTLLPGLSAQLNITPEQIQQLTALNIQHIQVHNQAGGPLLLVNGLSMPSARWHDDSLMHTLSTLDALGVDQVPSTAADLLPLIQQLGVAVVARFPLQDGVQVVPLHDTDPNSAAAMGRQARDQFLATMGRSPIISIPVVYDTDGTWRVNGVTENEYMALLPGVPWNALHLSHDAIAELQKAGISRMTITTDPDGIGASVNGESLPHIGWSEGEVQNLIVLAQQMGLIEQYGVQITPEQIEFVSQTLLPIIQASNVTIMVEFP